MLNAHSGQVGQLQQEQRDAHCLAWLRQLAKQSLDHNNQLSRCPSTSIPCSRGKWVIYDLPFRVNDNNLINMKALTNSLQRLKASLSSSCNVLITNLLTEKKTLFWDTGQLQDNVLRICLDAAMTTFSFSTCLNSSTTWKSHHSAQEAQQEVELVI